ncbi:MAG: glycosyltransferase family 9 protein [Chloroflexi bacterium]|nr:glycosyltransferase family 9 protein [Chloroflexota bacterium]
MHLAALALRPLVRVSDGPVRVLLIRPDNIGDVLLTSSAVQVLEETMPAEHITYLVGPWAAGAARQGPLGKRVETLPFPGFGGRRKAHLLEPYAELMRSARLLRRRSYRAAVVLRPDHWWGALLCLAAGIPVRVGYATPETSALLSQALPRPDERMHATGQATALVVALLQTLGVAARAGEPGGASFEPTAEDSHAARVWLNQNLAEPSRSVALHPLSGASLKTWPDERWVALADRLHAAGTPVVLSGAPGERGMLTALGARMQHPPAAVLSDVPLGMAAAVFERLGAVVGPDSGALHLAAARGAPTVRLYGPASAMVFGPDPTAPLQVVLQSRSLPCVPCGSLVNPPCGARVEPPCMLAISVPEVAAALAGILEARARRAS